MTTAPLFSSVNRALFTHEYCLHIGRVRDDADDDIRTRRRFFGRADAHATRGDDLVNARPVTAVVHIELITGFEQVLGHGRAHDPQADKANWRLPRCC